MIKMKKKCLLLALVVVTLLLSVCGCALGKDEAMDALLTEALTALQAEDYDKLTSMLSEDVREQLGGSTAPLQEMHDVFRGTLQSRRTTGWNVKSNFINGAKVVTKEFSYSVTTDEGTYHVLLSTMSSAEDSGITQFQIAPQTAASPGNAFFQFFNAGSLAMLMFSLLVLAFCIITTVFAAKSNIKMKPLWIVLIWILQSGFTVTSTNQSFHFGLELIKVSFSGYRALPGGGFSLTVLLPVGAILYWILRKKLIQPDAPSQNNPPYYGPGPFPQ